jgi:hypothetical protein
MARKDTQDAVEAPETALEPQEAPEPVEAVQDAPEPAPEAVEDDEADEPDPQYDPETQIMGADGEVKAMPSGPWTAAVTAKGNLRRSKGLLVEAG